MFEHRLGTIHLMLSLYSHSLLTLAFFPLAVLVKGKFLYLWAIVYKRV